MRVSHETIYRSLFIQARGVLKKELLVLRKGLATVQILATHHVPADAFFRLNSARWVPSQQFFHNLLCHMNQYPDEIMPFAGRLCGDSGGYLDRVSSPNQSLSGLDVPR